MPKGTPVHRCVQRVAEKQGGSKTSPVNAYAACQAKLKRSYKTNKPIKGADEEAYPVEEEKAEPIDANIRGGDMGTGRWWRKK